MKVGDLIKIKDGEAPRNGRGYGTILMFDMHKHEHISKVLWNTGKSGWILTKRIEFINTRMQIEQKRSII